MARKNDEPVLTLYNFDVARRDRSYPAGGGRGKLYSAGKWGFVREVFQLRAGDTVGCFRVVQALSNAGMDQLYLAVDTRDEREVSLKILPRQDPFHPVLKDYFRRQEQVFRAVNHPNVLKFIASGETGLFDFIVLEHVTGVTMKARLAAEGPAGRVSTFSWMQDLALGLHALHQKGIVHGGLGSENVIITKGRQIRLIDFSTVEVKKRLELLPLVPITDFTEASGHVGEVNEGSDDIEAVGVPDAPAQQAEGGYKPADTVFPEGEPTDDICGNCEDGDLSQAGDEEGRGVLPACDNEEQPVLGLDIDEIIESLHRDDYGLALSRPMMGRLDRVAPEVIRGGEATEVSDVYALGVLFYEMMTGRPLFDELYSPAVVLDRQRRLDERGFALPLKDAGDLYNALDELIYDMLRYDSDKRMPSSAALIARLDEIASYVGGKVFVACNNENRRVAQREAADVHLWRALKLIDDGLPVAAIAELLDASIFAHALEPVGRRMIARELDILMLGLTPGSSGALGVERVHFLKYLNDLLDISGKIHGRAEQSVRELLVIHRVGGLVAEDVLERFLQDQVFRRPRSYQFSAAYVRRICVINKDFAQPVWIRFIRDLISRDLVDEASCELGGFERMLGPGRVDQSTMALFAAARARRSERTEEFRRVIEDMEQVLEAHRLVLACREFLDRHGDNIYALGKMRDYLLRCGKAQEADDVLYRLGVVHFTGGSLEEAERIFARVLLSDPQHEGAATHLYCSLLRHGRAPRETPGNYEELVDTVSTAYRDLFESLETETN